jgi:tetratricopeptide (TPR) repeat protein
MENGESDALDNADAAELAARRAIETDANDWREHAALTDALVARKQVQEAIVAARRALALAPDEPDAHLALADALLAVVPRRMKTRAAAFAEIDRAELLGADAGDLAGRRAQPRSTAYNVIYWVSFCLLMSAMNMGGVTRTVSLIGMVALTIAAAVLRVRHYGQTFREVLGTKREISRHRLPTDDQVYQRAAAAAAAVAILVLPAAALSIPGADGDAQSLPAAWLLLGCIPVVGVASWIGVDRWLRPGTVIRALQHDAYTAISISITFILATASPVMALDKVQRPGLWFTLLMVQFAWIAGSAIAGAKLTSRRKKAVL